jgi:hypothetical protein
VSEPRRYENDPRAEREVLRLRAAAGAVALVAGAWLVLLPDWLPRLFGVLGCGFGALWIARWRRGPTPATEAYLELSDAVLLRRTGDVVERVPWADVRDVEVDEDRLVVRVERQGETPMLLEPRYGLGLYALRDEVRLAWRRARDARATMDTV